MTSAISKIFVAAALLAAVPHARADGCDRRPEPAVVVTDVPPAPPPGWRDGPERWREGVGYDGWRRDRQGWRERELRELRHEYRELDEARARFYAEWGWHPRKVARFERWYGERRAELDRRWEAVNARYAWR
jgi:hypothetical protein